MDEENIGTETINDVTETSITEPAFTKRQLVASNKYQDETDILNAVLEDDKVYTLDEVESKINEFMHKEVQ